jgi:hypothetical protein
MKMEEAKDLIKADKSLKKLEYFKNLIKDHRKNGIAVSTKMILIEGRRLATEMSITDFAGTSLCERCMRRNGHCMHTKTTWVEPKVSRLMPPSAQQLC